jgi:hypothetical protein
MRWPQRDRVSLLVVHAGALLLLFGYSSVAVAQCGCGKYGCDQLFSCWCGGLGTTCNNSPGCSSCAVCGCNCGEYCSDLIECPRCDIKYCSAANCGGSCPADGECGWCRQSAGCTCGGVISYCKSAKCAATCPGGGNSSCNSCPTYGGTRLSCAVTCKAGGCLGFNCNCGYICANGATCPAGGLVMYPPYCEYSSNKCCNGPTCTCCADCSNPVVAHTCTCGTCNWNNPGCMQLGGPKSLSTEVLALFRKSVSDFLQQFHSLVQRLL